MQRDHPPPFTQTGLRPGHNAGVPQGSQTHHPYTPGAGGTALSVSQQVSVQDLRMAGLSAAGFQPPQMQSYAGMPQNARPSGSSGHPDPGQNVQNVPQGYYRNSQAGPGPVRSNSTSQAQYSPYPQPQFNNGYAQVIAGHGHYPVPPANHAQSLSHDGRRASMPSLNAGPSQSSQVSQTHTAPGRQNGMPQAPEPPRPHPQPRGPERNPPAIQPSPASAPHPQFPQMQASAPSQPRNALPTPPGTSAGPSNPPPSPARDVMAMMSQSANQQARLILEPMRDSMADSLSAVHVAFTQELSKAHAMFVKSETKAVEAQVCLASLRDEFAHVCTERDRALGRCEQMKKEREAALEDIRKMNENLPKLVVEHYQLKADHDALQQEMVALKETNAQLREKATIALHAVLHYRTQTVPQSLLQHSTGAQGVKSEFPAATPGVAGPVAGVQVKEEHVVMKEPHSPTDVDDDVAFALVRELKVRKQKQRDHTDPEPQRQRPQSISGQQPAPPSEAAAAPSSTRVDNSPFNHIPPTPPTYLSPQSRNTSFDNGPIAQKPPTHVTNGAQSSDADASTRGPKLEEVDGLQSAVLSSIPELGHADVTGELDIIDLTYDCEMTESPAKVAPDLPPLSHQPPDGDPLEERKRTVEPEWNERQETPNKKQRTEDEVEGLAAQDVMMEDDDSKEELNEAFLRSLIEAAEAMTSQETLTFEADQRMATPTPVSSGVEPGREDGEVTEPSRALGTEPTSNGVSDQGEHLPELGQVAPSGPRLVTNDPPFPPTGLLTPISPSPTSTRPPIPYPAHRFEIGHQQAPIIVARAPASVSVAPALSSTSKPTQAKPAEEAQPPSVSVCPPPPPSTPAPSPPPSSANPSPSSSVPPPLPHPTRSTSTATRPPLSVSAPSSSLSSASPFVLPPQVPPPVTPVVNAFAGINLSLPSPTNAVQLPTEVPVASASKPEPPRKKLGLNHIDLVYRRVGSGYYQCRFCERRHKEVPGCPSTKFASNAPGHILTEHVENAHPLSVQPMLEMTPEEIRETKQGLESMDMDNTPVSQRKRKSSG
ncbi:hypothetical protein LXA43DRAFT_1093578 [Ganoderma leucocontextum]|nr:hypothetical protein LXA43DRAFT_1093578 [Ganoderma leucocontextum]